MKTISDKCYYWPAGMSPRALIAFLCLVCSVDRMCLFGQVFEGALIPEVSSLKDMMASSQRERDPRGFWGGKRVVQRSGIVIEDGDYLVRKHYWLLDQFVVGEVAAVELVQGKVFVDVVFQSKAHWQRVVFPDREGDVRTTRERTVKITRYGQEEEEITARREIAGTKVDPDSCGVILSDDATGVRVRFPGTLVELEPPAFDAVVKRSVDWVDGYSDGGPRAIGPLSDEDGVFLGRVVGTMSRDRMIEVAWDATGIKQRHRYGVSGFYAVEIVENGRNLTPEMIAELRRSMTQNGAGGMMRNGQRGAGTIGAAAQGFGNSSPSAPFSGSYGLQPQGYGSQPPGADSQSNGSGSFTDSPPDDESTAGENAEKEAGEEGAG